MDEIKRKEINDAIAVIRKMCQEQSFCDDCPLSNCNYNGKGYYCTAPGMWQDIPQGWPDRR